MLTDDVYRVYIEPLRATQESRNNLHRTGVVEVPAARLFFPEDRPQALTAPLRTFLAASGQPA